MLEAVFAWVFLLMGVITQNPTYFVASGTFAIASRIYFDMKGGE